MTIPDTFDRSEAMAFLGALLEDVTTPLSWRVFDDTKRTKLAINFYGPFASVLPSLLDAQKSGCGVFVIVNETTPHGTEDAEVVSPRALYVDLDGVEAPAWPLPPSLVVQRSPTQVHAYWILEEGESIADFRPAQRQLIRFYGSDPSIHNESRVMRVPGFWHLKDPSRPEMYRVVHHAPTRVYKIADVLAAHPVAEAEPAPSVPVAGEVITAGGRHAALLSMAGWLRRGGRSAAQMLALLREFNREQCSPPKDDAEVVRIAHDYASKDANQFVTAMAEGLPERVLGPAPQVFVEDLIAEHHGTMRPALIRDFLRETEVANVIAPPKSRKSWLVSDLALSVATGSKWLGFECAQGAVLLVDNELHPQTIAKRFRDIAGARGLVPDDYAGRVAIWCARGANTDLAKIEGEIVRRALAISAKLIVLDALYRFMPEGSDENSNSDATSLYNLLDRIADRTGAAIICVHHTSKGNQLGKATTDVGAGAGAMSRAADTHAVLRVLEEPDCVALDAACRSWAGFTTVGLRWEFPRWRVDPTVDVSSERGKPERKERKKGSHDITPAEFGAAYVGPEPKTVSEIMLCATGDGLSESAARRLFDVAVTRGIAYQHQRAGGSGRQATYATEPPKHDISPAALILGYLAKNPDATNSEVAEETGVSERTVRRVRNDDKADKA